MRYSRCCYVVAIHANEEIRATYPITRRALNAFLCYTCNQLRCDAYAVAIGRGYAILSVELCCDLSLECFVERLKSLTGHLVTSDANVAKEYWAQGFWFRAVSPQDINSAISFINSVNPEEQIATLAQRCALHYCLHEGIDEANESPSVCHHIILIELQGRMKIELKWVDALSNLIKEINYSGGIVIRDCAAMRNHVHILCNISPTKSLAKAVEELRTKILQHMHANIHFRKFEGWHPDVVAYAISDHKYREEEYQLYIQDKMHLRQSIRNEMSFIYQKLNIPYIISLH